MPNCPAPWSVTRMQWANPTVTTIGRVDFSTAAGWEECPVRKPDEQVFRFSPDNADSIPMSTHIAQGESL